MDNIEEKESPRKIEEHEQNRDSYCHACKRNLKDLSENPESVLCTTCRERYIHYPFPKWLFAVMAVVLIICAAAFFHVPALVSDYKTYKAAESAYTHMNYNTAANKYLLFSDSYNSSICIHEQLFLALVKAQRFDEAANVFTKYLEGQESDPEAYDEINDYATLLNGYYTTVEKISKVIPTDTKLQNPSKLYDQVESFSGNKEYDQSIVLYYLAQLNVSMDKTDLAIRQYQQAYTTQPKYTFILSDIGIAQRRMKQYDAAISTYSDALTKNADDETAYRGLGVVYMLKGDYENGLEYSEKAYKLNPTGAYVAETYATALYANNKEDEAIKIYNELKKNKDYVVDQEYENYFAGKSTLEKLYLY